MEFDTVIENKKQYFQNDYYVALANSQDVKVSFNIWAAIFGAAWCFYRKMYLVGISYFLIFFVSNSILIYVFSNASATIVAAINIIVFRATLGLFANRIYIKKSITEIDEIVKTESQETLKLKLKKAGGVSEVAVILYYVASVGFNVFLMLAEIKL